MTDIERSNLCLRIAKAQPDWARPGMACQDEKADWPLWRCGTHSTGNVLMWYNLRLGSAWCGQSKRLVSTRSFLRAFANGPDWRDEVTVLGLLALDRFTLSGGSGPTDAWLCEIRGKPPHVAETRTDAILAAVCAALERKHAVA